MAKQSSSIPSSGIEAEEIAQATCGRTMEVFCGDAQGAASMSTTSAVAESTRQAKRTVDIATLSEDEVLSMMHGTVKAMIEFANNTRNVHRGLKNKLKNTSLLLSQFLRLRKSSGAVPETRPGVQEVAANPQLRSMELKVAQMAREQTTFFQQMKAQQTDWQAQQQEWLMKLEERWKERVVGGEPIQETSTQTGDDNKARHTDDEAVMIAGRRSPRKRRGPRTRPTRASPK